jgi:hypothetical protein
LTKIFRSSGEGADTSSNPDVVIAAYKKLIRQQDDVIAQLKQQISQLSFAANLGRNAI